MINRLFEEVTPEQWKQVAHPHLDVVQALQYLRAASNVNKSVKIRIPPDLRKETKRARVLEYSKRLRMHVCTQFVQPDWLYIKLIRRNVKPGERKRGLVPLDRRLK